MRRAAVAIAVTALAAAAPAAQAAPSWGPVQTLATEPGARGPLVAAGRAGQAAAAWMGRDNGIRVTYRLPSGRWAAPTRIEPGGSALDLAMGGDGTAVAVWLDEAGRVRSTIREPGGRWSRPTTRSQGMASGLQIEVDSFGRAVAIWTRAGRLEMAEKAPGERWSRARYLADGYGQPNFAVAPGGVAAIVWFTYRHPEFVMRAVTRRPSGEFAEPVDVPIPSSAARAGLTVTPLGWDQVLILARASVPGVRTFVTIGRDGTVGPLQVDETTAALPVLADSDALSFTGLGEAVLATRTPDLLAIETSIRPVGQPFGSFRTLVREPTQLSFPVVTVAPEGGAAVVWQRLSGRTFRVGAAIRHARAPGFGPPERVNGAGPRPLGPAISPALEPPRVAVGDDGSATVLWANCWSNNRCVVQAATHRARIR